MQIFSHYLYSVLGIAGVKFHTLPLTSVRVLKTRVMVVYVTVCAILYTLGVFPSLPSARQHPSYRDCLEVKREYYQNCSVLGYVTQCSQSEAHLIGAVLTGPADWVYHIGTLVPCVEAVA